MKKCGASLVRGEMQWKPQMTLSTRQTSELEKAGSLMNWRRGAVGAPCLSVGCSGNRGVSQSLTRLSPSSSSPRHLPKRDGNTSSKSHVRECSQQLYLQPPEGRLPWVHPPRCPERRSSNCPEHFLAILSRTSHHDKLQAFPPKAVIRQRHRQSQNYCDFPSKYCFCSPIW